MPRPVDAVGLSVGHALFVSLAYPTGPPALLSCPCSPNLLERPSDNCRKASLRTPKRGHKGPEKSTVSAPLVPPKADAQGCSNDLSDSLSLGHWVNKKVSSASRPQRISPTTRAPLRRGSERGAPRHPTRCPSRPALSHRGPCCPALLGLLLSLRLR